MKTRIFILSVFLALFVPALPGLCQSYQPGFRTLGIASIEPRIRIDIAIWYPALRQPKDISIPPWTFQGAWNARPAEGRFPLIILSHGTSAERLAYHELASFLAREGFVVAAPTHGRDCMYNMDDLFTWAQLDERINEIRETVNSVLQDKDLAPVLDPGRIGLIGFGSGATAALLLGGALPDCASWPDYQRMASPHDAYMTPWAHERMNKLCKLLPLAESRADSRIRAIAAIAPGFGMLFNSRSFDSFYPPLLLVSAGQDKFNRSDLHVGRIARFLGNHAKILDLPAADAGALLSSCPENLAKELPGLCDSVSKEQRAQIHAILDNALLAFFRHYLLVSGNLPHIPPSSRNAQ